MIFARRSRVAPVVCALLLLPLLGGCASAKFYWQAACGQLELLSRRVPVDEVLADESVPETVRTRLAAAHDARQFAARELALPDNDSYQTYADLERPYALWNVFAAPEFSVEPETWCFPFAGCVAYRGYFREAHAGGEVARLQRRGLDAYYAGVGAYSTLGRFADPILNTMLAGDELRTVATIFHELAHQIVYRPSDAPFSESFASFVEREGVRRYLAARDRDSDYARYERSIEYQEAFAALVVGAREGLAEVYARPQDEVAMRAAKTGAFAQLKADYEALKVRWGGYAGYDRWFARDLNNAHLVSVSTYNQWVAAFSQLLAEHDGDLPAFYAAVRTLAEEDDAGVVARLSALDARTKSAAPTSPTIRVRAADGVTVYGERYFGGLDPDAPLILLFHQGGSNGRGEYAALAQWLNASGYRAIAWDQRTGGDVYGASNRTLAGLAAGADPGYCEAYPDLQAALHHAVANEHASRVIVWGSSYSGSLVFRLAQEHPDRIAGVIAFSPASGGPMGPCRARNWLEDLATPALALRPAAEMERAPSVEQRAILTAAGVEFRVVDNGVHGSSMLVDERTGHDMSALRDAVRAWLDQRRAKPAR